MQKGLSSFQIVLLSVFGALGVAGVLIFALVTAGGASNGPGAVTVWGMFDKTVVTTVLHDAADKDNRLSQVTYVQKDQSTYEAELTNALAAGTGPDLFILRSDYVMRDSDKVSMIPYSVFSKEQFTSTFVDGTSPYLASSGVVAVPLLVDPLVLYWNRDLLSAAGIAQPPQYWDEIPAMARLVTQKTDTGSIKKSAIAFGEYENIPAAKDIVAMLILQAGGKITTRDSSGRIIPALSSANTGVGNTVAALRYYLEFADPSKSDYSWNRAMPNARQAFAAGDLALYVGYASEESLIRISNQNLSFAIAPVPQIRNGANTADAGRGYALAIPKASRNPQGALTVAFLLASKDVSSALSTVLGIPSARRDSLTGNTGNDKLFGRMALMMRSWADPDPEQTDDVFRAMIGDVESGAFRIEDAMQRADQQMAKILGL